MRRPLLVLLAGALVGAAALIGVGATPAAALPGFSDGTATGKGPGGAVAKVRVGPQKDFDRFVVEFTGGLPDWQVSYVDQIVADGSGDPVPVKGTAFVTVTLMKTAADAPSAAASPNYPGILQVVDAGLGFEGVTTYGLGTAQKAGIRVFTLSGPPRLVVDVAHPTATSSSSAPPSSTSASPATTTDAAAPSTDDGLVISDAPAASSSDGDTTSTLVVFVLIAVALFAAVLGFVLLGRSRRT